MRKNNSELLNCFVFVFVFFNFFGVELFSGQDEVRTSQPATLVVGLSAFRSHAPTTQPSRRLKVYQLLITGHPKLIMLFSFFLITIYHAVYVDTPR